MEVQAVRAQGWVVQAREPGAVVQAWEEVVVRVVSEQAVQEGRVRAEEARAARVQAQARQVEPVMRHAAAMVARLAESQLMAAATTREKTMVAVVERSERAGVSRVPPRG